VPPSERFTQSIGLGDFPSARAMPPTDQNTSTVPTTSLLLAENAEGPT
jgi:hypothetical protein